jgi:hypothetical protein
MEYGDTFFILASHPFPGFPIEQQSEKPLIEGKYIFKYKGIKIGENYFKFSKINLAK